MDRNELKLRARVVLGERIFGEQWLYALLVCFLGSAIMSAAASVTRGIAVIAVEGPILLGLDYTFLKQSRDGQKVDIASLFYGFKNDFLGCFLLGLLSSIFIALWSLLLIVPGIVKAYGWSMIYYIKIENPELETRACMDRSAELMNGHKWELFMLDLSFLGWYILGALCLGVGVLFVAPYHSAARAEFYRALTEN